MNMAPERRQRGAALLMLLMIAGVLGAFFAMRIFGGVRQQVEKERATQAAMVQAHDALLGFAAINGRLPCPAAPAATGVASPAVSGPCTNNYNGFLPAMTLGLSGVDANGYLLDGWGGRVRYAVTIANANAATTTNGIQLAPMASFAPDLRVCGESTCIPAQVLTSSAVAVIFSLGPNMGVAVGLDETANQNIDRDFVSHPKTEAKPPIEEFDDLLIWLAPGTCTVGPCPPNPWQPSNSLFFVMTQANKLP